MIIRAPWTNAQVFALNLWQNNPAVHPFTCGNDRGDAAHVHDASFTGKHDFGILLATNEGWVCPVCGYAQDWAHDFMMNQ